MRNKLIIVISIFLLSSAYQASAQKLINTPYSRFNIGTLEPQASFRSLGMGGVSTALRDNSTISFTNPASYCSFDTISFVFDFGLDYAKNFLSSGSTKYSSSDVDFNHLIIGFPISKRWGLAAGVAPVSSGYYNITEAVNSSSPDYDPTTGAYTTTHSGDGGVTKVFLGSGVQIGKHFAVGANINFLSGQLSRINQNVFSDFYNVFQNSSSENISFSGINFDYGVQYITTFKNNYFLILGASINTRNSFNTKYNQLSLKYTAYSAVDTISYASDNSAKTTIPSTIRAGLSFGKKNKFTTSIDYITSNWATSKIPGSVGYAANTKELLFGAEFIPDKFSNYSYLSRVEYRLGGHFGDNYLVINGQQLKEYGASFGIGLPMRTYSKTNLYIDFTRRQGNNLPNEDYLSVGLSLNLYDFWFLKRKFD
jgi:hypothetical protein